jgi:hypothetical protein
MTAESLKARARSSARAQLAEVTAERDALLAAVTELQAASTPAFRRDSLPPADARPQARDVIADALGRYTLAAPRPRAGRSTPFPVDAATNALAALTSAGFLVIHQNRVPPEVLAAVAGYQDAP